MKINLARATCYLHSVWGCRCTLGIAKIPPSPFCPVFPHVFPAFSQVKKISTKHSLRIYIKKNRLHSGAQKIRCTEQNKQTLTTTFTTGKQYCYIEYSPKRNTKLGQQNTKKPNNCGVRTYSPPLYHYRIFLLNIQYIY